MSGIFQFSMTLGIETDGTSTNYDDAELVNIEEMIAPQSLWSKGRSILLPHAEGEGLSTPVLPSPRDDTRALSAWRGVMSLLGRKTTFLSSKADPFEIESFKAYLRCIRQFAKRLVPIELGGGTVRQFGLFGRGTHSQEES